ncbi:MAG: T9SS type A sorting domain-containing protein, partial [Crocinitomicaceae bacterium]
ASTTGANGFLICDVDSANHFTYGQPSGTTYQYLSSYFITDAIDCSGRSSVILSFEQFYRYNNGVAMYVFVSNDSTNWTGYDVSGGIANNAASANPDVVNLNITNTAANQATVYLKIGWSARVYQWQIDDISLREADPFDVAHEESWWGTGNFQNQYYKIPLLQASPVTFYTSISNNTGAQIDNVQSDVTVTNSGGVDYTGSSMMVNLAAVETDTLSVAGWTPSAVGMHDVDFEAIVSGQTDGDPSNNSWSDRLEITQSLYGLDSLQNGGQSVASISNFSGNTGQPFKIGNVYEIINDGAIQCVEIGIANEPENDGASVFGEVYVWSTASSQWEFRGATDVVDLTTADLGTIINVPLLAEASVVAGEEALVVAGHYGGPTDGSGDAHFMYGQSVENYMVYGFDGLGDAYWLSNPRAIVIRANFECGLNVGENQMVDVDVFPNPTTEEINVEFNTDSFSSYRVIDLNGKALVEGDVNSANFSIDVRAFATGVYTLELLGDKHTVRKRVLVK